MSTTRSARIRLLAGVAFALTLVAGTAACSSSAKTAAPGTTVANIATTTFPGTTVPPGYVAGNKAVPPAALTAITKFLAVNGPPIGSWVITSVQASTIDPNYVLYRISPASGHEGENATGYGFAHLASAKWTALGFGTDAVGCAPGAPDDPIVPANVLVGFSITCAPAP